MKNAIQTKNITKKFTRSEQIKSLTKSIMIAFLLRRSLDLVIEAILSDHCEFDYPWLFHNSILVTELRK